MAADVNHADVSEPHGDGEEDLGVQEVGGTDSLLGDERTDEQAGSHAGETEEEGLEGYLVCGFQRRKPGDGGGFLLKAAFLNQVEK